MSFIKLIIMHNFMIITFFIIKINCETIHFTNSPSHLIRSKNFTTYKLDVPGSNSITIIEANDNIQNNNNNRSMTRNTDEIQNDEGLGKKMVYAPSLLEKFLQEYSEKVHNTPAPIRSSTTKQSANKITIVSRGDRYGMGYDAYIPDPSLSTPLDAGLGGGGGGGGERGGNKRNHHGSSTLNSNNPFNDKEGWVTLQAVPWSRSQISKWKPHKDDKPISGTISSVNIYRKNGQSSNTDTPAISYPSARPYFPNVYNDKNNYDDPDYQTTGGFYSSSSSSKYNGASGGGATVHQSVPWSNSGPSKRPQTYDKDMETSSTNFNDRWYDYGFRPNFDETKKPWEEDILVSDASSNVVRIPMPIKKKHTNTYSYHNNVENNYEISPPSSNRPLSHPSNGNGEWVLVSTTKGYQRTRGQRGIKFSNNPGSLNDTTNTNGFRTRKSVQLTVLPAKLNANNQPSMTTSHGGILEVDSSLQTVEDSAVEVASGNNHKKKIHNNTSTKILQAIPVLHDRNSDSSAVLAAVGAGMVPATVAMLMPMVMGRKKRSIDKNMEFIKQNNKNMKNVRKQNYKK